MSEIQDSQQHLSGIVTQLKEGLNAAADAIENTADGKNLAAELRRSLPLLKQMEEWAKTLPQERTRATLFSVIAALDDMLLKAVAEGRISPEIYGAHEEETSAPFLTEAIIAIGPEMEVSHDRMSVSAFIPKEYIKIWTPKLVRAGLERQGIAVEISDNKIQNLLKKPGVMQKTAVGKEPVSGEDAVIVDVIGLEKLTGKPFIDERDRANLKEINRIIDVARDQVLLEKKPATPGIPGMDVFGGEIPCMDGADVSFPAISNTIPAEEGMKLVSTVDGCLYKEGDRIVIMPALEIKENVDYATGNVNASVSVTVKKDVLTGFKVESSQDVVVQGTVEGAKIIAEGNLFLEGGVQGKEEAYIQTQKNIHAKFLNSARHVECQLLTVQGPVIQTKIRCRRFYGEGTSAEIMGGTIEAVDDICAEQIGSEIGVKTVIRLGHDVNDLEERIEKLKKVVLAIQQKLELYNKSLASLDHLMKKGKELTPHQKETYRKLNIQIEKAKELLASKEEERDKKESESVDAKNCQRMVRARKNIFPGAEFHLFDRFLDIKKPTGPASIQLVGESLEILPYQDRTLEEAGEIE
ncbi:MAG: FapA family protein [Candidatus Omnitrophota bacterium]